MNVLCIALFCLLPQSAEQAAPQRRSVPAEELVMEFYTPLHVEPLQLMKVVERLAGSTFNTTDADSVERAVDSLRLFDESILIYETQQRAAKLLGLLEKLDKVAATERAGRGARKDKSQAERESSTDVVTIPYRPKFLSLNDLRQALLPYHKRHQGSFDFVDDSGFLVMTVSQAVGDEVLALLARVDVPAPQLAVTSYIVRGTETPGDHPAPEELAKGLGQLVGYKHVEVQACSMLRASAVAGQLSMRLDVAGPCYYELKMEPAAFSEEQKAWTLEHCTLIRVPDDDSDQSFLEVIFNTETILYADEYTVLGATGSEPELIVIRIEQVSPITTR